jgi:hypothetical protein
LTSSFICDSTLCSVLAVGVESEDVLWLTGIMYDPL